MQTKVADTTSGERKSDRADTEVAVPAATPRRSWFVKGVALVATALTLWHVFASFLWIFPPSPLRELTPGNSLSAYMLPMFGQSWSVFAPDPINGDYHFNVRATIHNNGEDTETGWVSATDVELSLVQYSLFPPRAGIQAEEIASSVKGSWEALDETQHEAVTADYLEDSWLSDLELALGAESDSAAKKHIANERMAVAYATQVARAIWGEEVTKVQIRVSRQNVVEFSERNDPEAVRPEPQLVPTGWRKVQVEPGQSEENFAAIFEAQFETLKRN